MDPIKDIQALINERAEKRLDGQLEELRKYLHSGFAANLLEISAIKVSVDGKSDNYRSAFWHTGSLAFAKLKETLLPKYIEDETRNFVKSVDKLRSDVENIVGQLPDFGDY